jgi:hypothetical protein
LWVRVPLPPPLKKKGIIVKNVYYNLTTEELETEITKIKNILLEYLYNKKLISHEVYSDMTKNYGFIIKKPSFFSRWWKSKKNINQLQYVLVKQVSITEPNENEEKPKPKLNVVELNKNKE